MHTKGASAPFFLAFGISRLRSDAMLQRALAAFSRSDYADALLAVEYVCRHLPTQAVPAVLRAKILEACRPELAPKAWYRAWCCDPENAHVQDLMLQAWLRAGALTSVIELGPVFLPARCRSGHHKPLVALLHKAGVKLSGACWRAGDFIEGMLFSAPAAGKAPRVRLTAADEHGGFGYDIVADGSLFRIACPRPRGVWSLSIDADGGRPILLQGSPLVFDAAIVPVPAASARPAGPLPVSIIIPVYRERDLVQGCIISVLNSLPLNATPAEIIVIDDASPEQALSQWLDELARAGRITLLRNRFNLGFIETTNRGLRLRPGHDAMLLNSDTLVHGDWIDRLSKTLHSGPDIASVTPWSNNGEISSFPKMSIATPAPTPEQLRDIDNRAAAARSRGSVDDIEIPSCCGFAMLMKRSVIDAIGVLDGVDLVRGYGEEVDWCLRARAVGYRHLVSTGVFIAHTGTVSFRFEKTLRVRQNRLVLDARFPDYQPEYQAFVRNDPLAPARAVLSAELENAGSAWMSASSKLIDGSAAIARPLPAALASSCQRIAVWHHLIGAAGAQKILALARAIAAHGPALKLRLLIIGAASEALWHTGVADIVPASISQENTLLGDAALVGLCACTALISSHGNVTPLGMPHIRLDDSFDPQGWLDKFLSERQSATTLT